MSDVVQFHRPATNEERHDYIREMLRSLSTLVRPDEVMLRHLLSMAVVHVAELKGSAREPRSRAIE